MRTSDSKLLFILCFLLFSYSASYSQSYLAQIDKTELQSMVNAIIDTTDIPGIHLILVSRDSLVHHVYSGVKQVNIESPMERDDLMHLGSNTKSMTAFVAAYLVEQNVLQWNTKFFDVFPELKSKVRETYLEITLEELLQHRARVQPYTEDEEFERLPKVTDEPILIQRLEWFEEVLSMDPMKIDTSEGYVYSNAGYSMAAAMMEKSTGKTYENLMQELLFEPLKMDGRFGWPENYSDNQPKGHYIHDNEDTLSILRPDEGYHIGRIIAPAGDVCISPSDYALYLQAQLKGLHSEDYILKSGSYSKMHTPPTGNSAYALGWGVGEITLDSGTYSLSTHNGSGGTYLCKTILIPELNIGISILINSAEDDQDLVTKRLRNGILRKVFEMIE